MSSRYQRIAEQILDTAGIKINGSDPWDVHVHDDRFYRRVLTRGELGIGESYMEGWWDCVQVEELIFRILKYNLDEQVRRKYNILITHLWASLFNLQSRRRAFIIGERHYDLGNDLFQSMLDQRLNYSCGWWKDARNLEEAQTGKLELICRKLYLKPGMRVLDIGCGWGAFGRYAAEKYQVEVVGITVSKEQVELGRKLCEGLPVEFRLLDYRSMDEKFDRIVSVGMVEHVGVKNYRTFFGVAERCLKDDGLFLLHTIGNIRSVKSVNPWTHRYIFPNGMLPSVAQIGRAMENLFVLEDWHNFGIDYYKTLMAWYRNFDENWPEILDRYPPYFYRMWKFYLLSSAGGFKAGRNQLWQLVLAKRGVPLGYQSVR
jgi:cyclopropane-fatty-acyl-phospholipid synthase